MRKQKSIKQILKQDFRSKINPNLKALFNDIQLQSELVPKITTIIEHYHIIKPTVNKIQEYTGRVKCQICGFTQSMDSKQVKRLFPDCNILFDTFREYCESNGIRMNHTKLYLGYKSYLTNEAYFPSDSMFIYIDNF